MARFCDINGYSYFAIRNRIKTLEAKNESLNSEQIVEKAIKKYEDRLEINRINEIFNKLKSGNINNINEIKDICEFLKIDFENISDLLNMDFSYNQAINMIWYFSDVKNEDDYKLITDKKLKDIFMLIDKLKEPNIEIEKFELYDSRNEMLQRQNKYIHKIIISLCREYEVKINGNNYEDFESELKLYFITFVNRVNLNIYGQIIKYMDLTIKGYFRTYLKKYKKQNNILSLDVAKYSNDKGTRKEKPLIDFVAYSNNFDLDLEDTSFSSNMLEILETLPKDDLSLIMLKYQENYDDEELADYLNLTVDEVRKKEIEILTLLKNNGNIKVMRKKL